MSFDPFNAFDGFGGGAVEKPNLVINGTFDSDISGWSAYNGSMAWDDGKIAWTGGNASGAYQVISTIIGRSYRVTASSVVAPVDHRVRVGNGTIPNAGIAETAISSAATVFVLDFVAQATSTYIYLRNSGAVGTVKWDNVSMREI